MSQKDQQQSINDMKVALMDLDNKIYEAEGEQPKWHAEVKKDEKPSVEDLKQQVKDIDYKIYAQQEKWTRLTKSEQDQRVAELKTSIQDLDNKIYVLEGKQPRWNFKETDDDRVEETKIAIPLMKDDITKSDEPCDGCLDDTPAEEPQWQWRKLSEKDNTESVEETKIAQDLPMVVEKKEESTKSDEPCVGWIWCIDGTDTPAEEKDDTESIEELKKMVKDIDYKIYAQQAKWAGMSKKVQDQRIQKLKATVADFDNKLYELEGKPAKWNTITQNDESYMM